MEKYCSEGRKEATRLTTELGSQTARLLALLALTVTTNKILLLLIRKGLKGH